MSFTLLYLRLVPIRDETSSIFSLQLSRQYGRRQFCWTGYSPSASFDQKLQCRYILFEMVAVVPKIWHDAFNAFILMRFSFLRLRLRRFHARQSLRIANLRLSPKLPSRLHETEQREFPSADETLQVTRLLVHRVWWRQSGEFVIVITCISQCAYGPFL